MSNSFCTECGTAVEAGSRFCAGCGTIVAEIPPQPVVELVAHQGKFDFSGTGLGLFWLWIWTTVLTVISFGLFFPWAIAAGVRWIAEHTKIDGRQLTFKGSGLGYFATWLLTVILIVITLGIYIPWGMCRMCRWGINNLYYAKSGDVEKF